MWGRSAEEALEDVPAVAEEAEKVRAKQTLPFGVDSMVASSARGRQTMYVCVLDQDGEVLLHRNMRCQAEELLRADPARTSQQDRVLWVS